MLTVLLVSFFGAMFFSVPIALAISGSSILAMELFSRVTPYFFANQVFNGLNNFTMIALPFFMMAGALMQYGGVSRRLVGFCKALVGWVPGSLGVVAVLACMIFAAISGSGPATVVSIGMIMLPLMRDENYDMGYASSLVAMSGGLGVVIPPSLPMITFATLVEGVSVGAMFMAGIIPGILLGLAEIVFNIILCKKRGMGITIKERPTLKSLWAAFKDAFLALMMPVIILGGIYGGLFTPTEAACVAVVYGLIVGVFVYKEIKWDTFKKILVDSAEMAASALFIIAMVDGFNFALTKQKVPVILSGFITSTFGTKYSFVCALAVLLLILGCFMSANAAIIILAPILGPIAKAMGYDMIQLGIVMIICLNIGMVTPPFGVHMFIASNITKEPIEKMFKYIWMLVGVAVIVLILLIFIPEISLYLPQHMHH